MGLKVPIKRNIYKIYKETMSELYNEVNVYKQMSIINIQNAAAISTWTVSPYV